MNLHHPEEVLQHPEEVLQRLADEQEIRALGYRFADACNRGDRAAFADLWSADGAWAIGSPFNVHARGLDDIMRTLEELSASWEFFVQMPHAPVVTLEGDGARSTWTMAEHAVSAAENRSYFNYARYDDRVVRHGGGWRFLERRYEYYYLDDEPLVVTGERP